MPGDIWSVFQVDQQLAQQPEMQNLRMLATAAPGAGFATPNATTSKE